MTKATTHTHSLEIMENRYIFFFIFRRDVAHITSTAMKNEQKKIEQIRMIASETDVYIWNMSIDWGLEKLIPNRNHDESKKKKTLERKWKKITDKKKLFILAGSINNILWFLLSYYQLVRLPNATKIYSPIWKRKNWFLCKLINSMCQTRL